MSRQVPIAMGGKMIYATALYLFTTHLTRNKFIAIAVVAMAAVLGVAWFVRRRRSRSGTD